MSKPIEINGTPVELECDICCSDLTAVYETVRGRDVLRVTPCRECLSEARENERSQYRLD